MGKQNITRSRTSLRVSKFEMKLSASVLTDLALTTASVMGFAYLIEETFSFLERRTFGEPESHQDKSTQVPSPRKLPDHLDRMEEQMVWVCGQRSTLELSLHAGKVPLSVSCSELRLSPSVQA